MENKQYLRYRKYVSSLLVKELIEHKLSVLETICKNKGVSLPKPITRPAILYLQQQMVDNAERLMRGHTLDFDGLVIDKVEHDIVKTANGVTQKIGRDDFDVIGECIAIAQHTNHLLGVDFRRVHITEARKKDLWKLHKLVKTPPRDNEKINHLLFTNNWIRLPRRIKPLRVSSFEQQFFLAEARSSVKPKVTLFNDDEIINISSTSKDYTCSLMAEVLVNDITDEMSIY